MDVEHKLEVVFGRHYGYSSYYRAPHLHSSGHALLVVA